MKNRLVASIFVAILGLGVTNGAWAVPGLEIAEDFALEEAAEGTVPQSLLNLDAEGYSNHLAANGCDNDPQIAAPIANLAVLAVAEEGWSVDDAHQEATATCDFSNAPSYSGGFNHSCARGMRGCR